MLSSLTVTKYMVSKDWTGYFAAITFCGTREQQKHAVNTTLVYYSLYIYMGNLSANSCLHLQQVWSNIGIRPPGECAYITLSPFSSAFGPNHLLREISSSWAAKCVFYLLLGAEQVANGRFIRAWQAEMLLWATAQLCFSQTKFWPHMRWPQDAHQLAFHYHSNNPLGTNQIASTTLSLLPRAYQRLEASK